MPKLFFIAFLAIASSSVSLYGDTRGVKMPKHKVEPFLKEYCISCHGPDKQKGQVRFDEVSWDITNNDTAQRWQDVLDVLNGGDMPPEDEKQPSDGEMSEALDTLTGAILKARKRLTDHGGEISMRRLNRREYANTIRDLFGFRLTEDMLPDDGEAATFDTVGAEQYFTSSHFDKYLDLGREIAKLGLDWSAKPRVEATVTRREQEERVTKRLREKLVDLDHKMAMKKAGATWQEMGFKDEGEMKILFSQFNNRAEKPRQYLQLPKVEEGIYLFEVNNETKRASINRVTDLRGTYRFRMRGGIYGSPPEIRKFVRIDNNNGPLEVLKVAGTDTKPELHEIEHRPSIRNRSLSFHVSENRADIRVMDAYLKRVDPEGDVASIYIDWLEIEGPFYDEKRSWFESLIYPEAPVKGKRIKTVWVPGNARELIEAFAFEAFRRKSPDPNYIDQLVALFESEFSENKKFNQSMSEVFGVILASPQFLFLQEAGDDQKRTLDNRELAIRLAYFLWSSQPDDELYAADLSDSGVLHQQVDRMLKDPKSGEFFKGFVNQWAEMDRFDAITVDESDFFHFNKGIRHSAAQEVIHFFKALVSENLPVSNLIDSDFVVVNPILAEHYEIEGDFENQFQKVVLPADSPRGGLPGQTAFLTLGSNGERSSPVIRGAVLMEKLLHDKPAPPPPNVPELGSGNRKPATNRQMVELHQKQAVCASCHRKMDAIGFGLENFDTVGKWRDTEKVGRKQVPIEPGGKLPGGVAFNSVNELKQALLTHEADLAEELVESLLAYSLGRTIEFSDSDDVAQILEKIASEKYPMRSMIQEITASALFRTK
ncbi:MAG: DUF1592 domain-containing protein [Verrucomicrobiales bacterium]|nr:DUF1592 domain-containing protein [Verrucomicrobiales bacterium]